MYQTALKAYDSVNKSTMSGRDVEAEVSDQGGPEAERETE